MTSAVAAHRQRHGWTQQRLADIVRVSRQTIIAIEKGNYEPSTSLALKLAHALDVHVEDLFVLTSEVVEQIEEALVKPADGGSIGTAD